MCTRAAHIVRQEGPLAKSHMSFRTSVIFSDRGNLKVSISYLSAIAQDVVKSILTWVHYYDLRDKCSRS